MRVHILPWALAGCEFGPEILELGPGYGASTDLLRSFCGHLTCVESDRHLATSLQKRMGATNTTVLWGDASEIQVPDATFDGAVCFMMLHHVTPMAKQDQLLVEMLRVLRPGGIFAGIDSLSSPMLRVLHSHDTVIMVDPATLSERLEAAGFEQVQVNVSRYAFRFSARKPFDILG